ncbi:MAG: cytidylate kinase-like family protein [Desulfobacterales bacterium]|jgi:cytidylate kinase|nr:cytidylate kinase-like family protein [Desulfobacteraceae bacterium]MBT7087285.1 cytidylate kinase-like family protein [Desulfobacterales bacterium]MBT7697378.1 cytidylate kinase-like family protein [Desulfobacterales bacterium]
MPVITISRGTYSKGKRIAEKLAAKLGYECISRDILLEASETFNIPEIQLVRALHDAPSVLERFTYGKERYIAFIREALLEHIQKDNIVYHGLAGHFFLQGISHVIKVRIISNFEDRIKEEMKRENISETKARYILKKDDGERRKWSLYNYGIDTSDANLYDLVIHVDTLTEDDAVEILFDMAGRQCFKTTSESKTILNDLVLGAKAQLALIEKFPMVEVTYKEGIAYLNFKKVTTDSGKITHQVYDLLKNFDEIKQIRTNLIPEVGFE